MELFFSRDLTRLAAEGALGPFHGREKVIAQALAVVGQDGKASVVFTGEPGVGKTAVVEALAELISKGDVPDTLRKVTIQELDTNQLVAGTIYHGQFEAKAKEFVDYLLSHRHVIVFMDEIHALLSVSSDVNRTSL